MSKIAVRSLCCVSVGLCSFWVTDSTDDFHRDLVIAEESWVSLPASLSVSVPSGVSSVSSR